MIPTENVRGVGPVLRLALAECGFRTAEDLANTNLVELLKVPGIGSASAPRLIAAAKTAIAKEEQRDPASKTETSLMTISSLRLAAEGAREDLAADDTFETAKTKAKAEKKKAKAAKKAAKLHAKVAKDAAKQKAKAAKKAAKLAAKVAKKVAKLNAARTEDGKAACKAEMKSKRQKLKERKEGTG